MNEPFNIIEVLNELKERKKYFSSEADFQLALAMQIEKKYGEHSVICEYAPDYESDVEESDVEDKKSRIHIDILYRNENIPIELKYRTKKAKIDFGAYKISLTNQGAHDEGSYGFWRDVCRIGEYVKKQNASEGYVVFLTNDGWYKNSDYSKCKDPHYYDQFNLNENRKMRNGTISGIKKSLKDVPNIEAEWMDWDTSYGFECYIAKINGGV